MSCPPMKRERKLPQRSDNVFTLRLLFRRIPLNVRIRTQLTRFIYKGNIPNPLNFQFFVA